MIALIGCCQLSMAGHCTPHLQGSHFLCKTSFKKILYYLLIFGFAGSLLLLRLFSSCGEWGLVCYSAQASHRGGSHVTENKL